MKSDFEESIDKYIKMLRIDQLKKKIIERRLQRLIDNKIDHVDFRNKRLLKHPFEKDKLFLITDLKKFNNPVILPPFSPLSYNDFIKEESN